MNKTKKFNAQIKESNDDSLKGKYIACNIIDDMKAPIWFTTWSEKEFKPLIQDVKILKQDVSDIKAQVGVLEKNVNTIYDILDRNNLK